jgi:DNA adenine methylase
MQKPYTIHNGNSLEVLKGLEENSIDSIVTDPPYFGRHVDYYNGWKEEDEELLFTLLSQTKAKFVLSTWHHTEWRKNDMIDKYWNQFRIITKDHFYHNGGKLENRKSVVEALVCNF